MCIQNLRAITESPYWNPILIHCWPLLSIIHFLNPFLMLKSVLLKDLQCLVTGIHEIALKNLTQEEQLLKLHLSSACDLTYAVSSKAQRIRHLSSQSNMGEYYPTLLEFCGHINHLDFCD